ncbi:hypothetical protein Gpo141_00012001 [Globisporangium polare]
MADSDASASNKDDRITEGVGAGGLLRRLLRRLNKHRPTGSLEWTLFVVTLGCIVWTLWLILLGVRPNDTINKVMNTTSYDDGAFWLLIEPTQELKLVGVFGFAIVLAGYVFILLKLTLWRHWAKSSRVRSRRIESAQRKLSSFKASVQQSVAGMASDSRTSSMAMRLVSFALEMMSGETTARKHMNVALKIVDSVLQLALLWLSLENGYPVVLIAILALIIVLNSIACVMLMCLKRFQSGLLQVLVDCLFAFLIAVGFPMLVLLYCLKSFKFDSKKLAINEAVFPPGVFERGARVIANPATLANVLSSLNSLRIQSATSFFTRVGTNLSLCFQFTTLVTRRHRLKQSNSSLYPYRHPVALLFVLLPVAVVVYVSHSIQASRTACAPHPECTEYAFRWITLRDGDKTQCPCLTLIDVSVAQRTYAEWQ